MLHTGQVEDSRQENSGIRCTRSLPQDGQITSEFHSTTKLMLVLLILPVRLTTAADEIRQGPLLKPTDDHCAPTWKSFATT